MTWVIVVVCGLLLALVLGAQTLPLSDANVYPDVTLAWSTPTNPLVSGVNIRERSVLGTNVVDVGMTTSLSVFGTVPGNGYLFDAQSYSNAGAVSAWSSPVGWTNYLVTIISQTYQVWASSNLLLSCTNPTWSTLFFSTSNGWLRATARLNPKDWNNIAFFPLLINWNGSLRSTNIIQYEITP
jgi:hypothetical protein